MNLIKRMDSRNASRLTGDKIDEALRMVGNFCHFISCIQRVLHAQCYPPTKITESWFYLWHLNVPTDDRRYNEEWSSWQKRSVHLSLGARTKLDSYRNRRYFQIASYFIWISNGNGTCLRACAHGCRILFMPPLQTIDMSTPLSSCKPFK